MMDWVRWTEHGPLPGSSILVEGLPGIGHVGQIVAEHLARSVDARLVAEVHSPDFPAQALVEDDGTAGLVGLRLQASDDGLLVLTGDTQPGTSHGHFAITEDILQRATAVGCRTVYTLGGIPAPGKQKVVAACSGQAMVARAREAGAECGGAGPKGGIMGASGVFLGLARRSGLDAVCLMGRSTGADPDVAAATEVLHVLARLLDRKLPTNGIEEVAERIRRRVASAEEVGYVPRPTDSDHHYIG